LGIETIEPYLLRKRNVILIPRNTRLPARCARKFATKSEGQRSIVIQVLEGESDLPGDCMAIGRTVVRDLPAGLPKGYPIQILFEYGTNGRLKVDAVVPGTPQQGRLELERDAGVSGDGIGRWRQIVSAAGAFDSFVLAALEHGKTPLPADETSKSAVDLDATELAPQLPSGTTNVGNRPAQVFPAELAQIKVLGEPSLLAEAPTAAAGMSARISGLAVYVVAILLGAGGGWYIYHALTSR
jgi:molecular chaperone DnaK (HSP70)